MNKDKYIIFSDVDGTIYLTGKPPMKATVKDIEFARSLGVEVVVATGNSSAFKSMTRLQDIIKTRYMISSNGATVYDFEEQKFIYEAAMDKSIVDKIIKKSIELGVVAMWWLDSTFFYSKGMWKEMHDVLSSMIDMDNSVEATESNGAFKIDLYHPTNDLAVLNELLKYINEIGGNLQIAQMTNGHIEVTDELATKGKTIEWFTNKFDVPMENTMGVGDSNNDLAMLKVVDCSYAMDNASKEVKEVSKYYTSDVLQNGMGEAIIDFLHRKKLDRQKQK